jgi:hypothetical protein
VFLIWCIALNFRLPAGNNGSLPTGEHQKAEVAPLSNRGKTILNSDKDVDDKTRDLFVIVPLGIGVIIFSPSSPHGFVQM